MLLCFQHCRNLTLTIVAFGLWSIGAAPSIAQSRAQHSAPKDVLCPTSDTGLKLPPGFCATIFADGIGHARHLVVAPDGVVYVNTWSGRYYGNDTPHAGGFLVAP